MLEVKSMSYDIDIVKNWFRQNSTKFIFIYNKQIWSNTLNFN